MIGPIQATRGDTDRMKAALIGAGQIARQHLACLRELPASRSSASATCRGRWPSRPPSGSAWRAGSPTTGPCSTRSRPDVVHVTTPPTSHYPLAMAALDAGAHVVLEKPATVTFDQLTHLVDHAQAKGRALVEDYNYLYNGATRQILGLIESGEFGEVTHVEVFLCLDILGEGARSPTPTPPTPACRCPAGRSPTS